MLRISVYSIKNTATNGKEAVDMFKSFEIKHDVILIDHRMLIKNGIEAAKEILQINKSSKIIFNGADQNVKKTALANGAISFKEKPFTMKELINDIQEVL